MLTVLDVPYVEDDPRMAWVVADEGRGLDLAEGDPEVVRRWLSRVGTAASAAEVFAPGSAAQ